MSKYWCKPCQVFVVDTKIGRSQHESTWKHKSSIQKQLSLLHKENQQKEKDLKDAARVLNEIEKEVESERKPNRGVEAKSTEKTISSSIIKKRERENTQDFSITEIKDPTPEQPKKKVQVRTSKGLPNSWKIEDKILVPDDIPNVVTTTSSIKKEEQDNSAVVTKTSLFKKRKPKS